MKIFKKNHRANHATLQQEELAFKMANRIIQTQRKIANYLNRKTRNLSGRVKQVLLIVFCFLFAAINIYLLVCS